MHTSAPHLNLLFGPNWMKRVKHARPVEQKRRLKPDISRAVGPPSFWPIDDRPDNSAMDRITLAKKGDARF